MSDKTAMCLCHNNLSAKRVKAENRWRTLIVLVLVAGVVACGSNTATTPATPAPLTWDILGTITSGGAPVIGATVTILDGPNAGLSTTSGHNGFYRFVQIIQVGFTLEVRAAGYATVTHAVTLETAGIVNVDLTRLP